MSWNLILFSSPLLCSGSLRTKHSVCMAADKTEKKYNIYLYHTRDTLILSQAICFGPLVGRTLTYLSHSTQSVDFDINGNG